MLLDQSEIEEGEAEESRPEEVETEVFDRELYYQMYDTITSELPAIKIRNNFLQKKMVEYFRKRNVNRFIWLLLPISLFLFRWSMFSKRQINT